LHTTAEKSAVDPFNGLVKLPKWTSSTYFDNCIQPNKHIIFMGLFKIGYQFTIFQNCSWTNLGYWKEGQQSGQEHWRVHWDIDNLKRWKQTTEILLLLYIVKEESHSFILVSSLHGWSCYRITTYEYQWNFVGHCWNWPQTLLYAYKVKTPKHPQPRLYCLIWSAGDKIR
jgi:hypothetical protein